jgi:Na+-driven multidrug efflux pump
MMFIDVGRIPLHILIGYYLIVEYKMDLFGCALTTNLVYLIKFIVAFAIIHLFKKNNQDLREGFFIKINHETTRNFKRFL